MKNSLLILSLLCISFSSSLAQSPVTYFDSTSFWGFYWWHQTPNFPGTCTHDVYNYWNIDGDSTVMGHTWYKLYSTGQYHIHCTYPDADQTSQYAHRYTGLLRQEGKQMRMVFPNTFTDSVIYDFNMQTGENFLPVPPYPSSPYNIVAAIWPFSNDTTRLVFTSEIPNCLGNQWIEGIGAARGAIFPPEVISCCSAECVDKFGSLSCYRMQGNDFGFSKCTENWQHYQAIVQSVADTKPGLVTAEAPKVWLSPNPGHDHLDLHVFGMNVRDIRLVNYSGKVLRFQSDFTMAADSLFSLAVGDLPTGLYQVLVYGESSVMALKWVKI